MKIFIKIFSLSILLYQVVGACDVCGCDVGGGGGVFSQANESVTLGMKYAYQSFDASIDYDSQYFADENSTDTYHSIALSLSLPLWGPLYVVSVVPLKYNKMAGSHLNADLQGWGDIEVDLIAELWKNEMQGESSLRQRLLLSVGSIVPTGGYDAQRQGEKLNENFQLGTGAYAFVGGMGYVIRNLQWGGRVEGYFKTFAENPLGYQKGNNYNLLFSAQKFYSLGKGEFLGEMGYQLDERAEDKDNGILRLNRGGTRQSLLLALGVQWGDFNVKLQSDVVIFQKYSLDKGASLKASPRFALSWSWRFQGGMNSETMEVM